MDKLKVVLGHLKKQHFWVLTILVLLLTLAGWQMASGKLAEEYTSNRSKVKSQFDSVRAIVNQTDHPNETFEQVVNQYTADLKRDVESAWNYVYADQKSKVLKWPQELGPRFIEWINDPDHQNADIPQVYREMYLNYIKNEFPRLLEVVDAKPYWYAEDEVAVPGRSPMGRGDNMQAPGALRNQVVPSVPRKDYLVIWDKKDQEAIDTSLDFTSSTPDSMTTRFCQENLWVYHALLDAIAAVNKGATGNHNAKIKEIISISIGPDAAAILVESLANGRILIPDGVMPPAYTPNIGPALGGDAEAPAAAPRMMDDEMPGRGGVGVASAGKWSIDQRYVNEKGLPLAAGTTGPAEFKRMPIVLRLRMDQREISDLLVELANSPLPVDIRQVRINTKIPGLTNSAPSMFGGKDASGGRGGRGVADMINRERNSETSSQSPYDVGTELHGVIYIFNPPDRSLRVTTGADGETVAPAPVADVPATVDAPPAATPENEAVNAAPEPAVAPVDQTNETKPADAPPVDEGAEFQQGTPATTPSPPVANE